MKPGLFVRDETVNRVDHQPQTLDVVVVPQPRLRFGRIVRRRVNHALLCAHHGLATFRLHLSHLGVWLWPVKPHSSAMRHLIETVLRSDRTDLNWLEQHVESGDSRHFLIQHQKVCPGLHRKKPRR